MNCICGGVTHVVDSRKSGNEVKRYRKCKMCGKKHTTVERFEMVAAKPELMAAPQKQSRSITAADRKRRQMEARRKVEDMHLKRQVPNYFIEDEYDE